MSDHSNDKSINETLDVIRKALQEDSTSNYDDILVLNQLVKEDGTIDIIEDQMIQKEEIKKILENKLSEVFDQKFEKWLDKKLPHYLEKHFLNKNN